MHAAIRAAEDARDNALSDSEDTRFASIDTTDVEEQARQERQDVENLRRRILLTDALTMSAGWGIAYRYVWDWKGFVIPGRPCPHQRDSSYSYYYSDATNIGRDAYIRKYWHNTQPIERTYTKERLAAAENVVDELEKYIQGRMDYWWENKDERQYRECEDALSWFSEKKAEIVEGNPLPTD